MAQKGWKAVIPPPAIDWPWCAIKQIAARACPSRLKTRASSRCSRFQLALELVQKSPIGAIGHDLLRSRLYHARFVQAHWEVPDCIFGVVFTPFVVRDIA